MELPAHWEDEEIASVADVELRSSLVAFKKSTEELWESLSAVIKLNTPAFFSPDLDPPVHENLELFRWAFTFAWTRSFGWGVPYLMLIPLVDAINHADFSQVKMDLFRTFSHLGL